MMLYLIYLLRYTGEHLRPVEYKTIYLYGKYLRNKNKKFSNVKKNYYFVVVVVVFLYHFIFIYPFLCIEKNIYLYCMKMYLTLN